MNRLLAIGGALATIAALAPAPSGGAEVEVSLEWVGAAAGPPPAAVLLAEPEGAVPDGRGPLRWDLEGPARSIDLADDRAWYLWAEAPGYWGEDLRIARGTERVRLRMFPVGVVEGGLAPLETSPDALEVGFRAATAAGGEIVGLVDCPVERRRWRCELPSGRLDLSVRSGLFVMLPISGLSVPAGGRLELGDLELRLGGAVTGRVELEGGAPPSAECRARLEAAEAAAGEAATLVESVSAEGWFELAGAPPGAYRVTVEEPGYLPATSEAVRIIAGVRLELPEPLRLSLSARLDLAFEPQLDPFGDPWSFTLTGLEGEARPSRSERAGSDGRWTAEALAPGRYELRPAGRIEPSWFSQEFVVEAGGSVVLVESPIVAVEGWLTIGGEPLMATLVLGASGDARSRIRLDADDAGFLVGLLPRAGSWPAKVEAPSEGLSRQLGAIDVVSDGTGRASIRIDLPGTRLEGQVTDHLGRPVAGATVRVRSRTTRQVKRIVTGADGRFLVRGLPAAPVSVRAEAPGTRPTAWFEVSLEPGATAAPLQLVVVPRP